MVRVLYISMCVNMSIYPSIYLYTCILVDIVVLGAAVFPGTTALFVIFEPRHQLMVRAEYKYIYIYVCIDILYKYRYIYWGAAVFPGTTAGFVIFEPRHRLMVRVESIRLYVCMSIYLSIYIHVY